MRISNLEIRRNYKSGKGWSLDGKIAFDEDGIGGISLVLDDRAISQIIFACADALERVSQESANKLREAILESISDVKRLTA